MRTIRPARKRVVVAKVVRSTLLLVPLAGSGCPAPANNGYVDCYEIRTEYWPIPDAGLLYDDGGMLNCSALCENSRVDPGQCSVVDDAGPGGFPGWDGGGEAVACRRRVPFGGCGRAPRGQVQLAQPKGSALDWARWAFASEAASVPAFQQLAEDLTAANAPPALVERARAGALDEERHAQAMALLCEHLGGHAPERPQVSLAGRQPLEAILEHNALHGCVGETWGAVVALHQAQHARDSVVRGLMHAIAGDEVRHAQLAWDIAGWAEESLGLTANCIMTPTARLAAELDAASETQLGLPQGETSARLWRAMTQQLG